MKSLNSFCSNYLVIIIIALAVSACEKKDLSSPQATTPVYLSDTMAARELGKHLILKDNELSLHITQQEAVKLGVSPEFYKLFFNSVDKANDHIKKTLIEQPETEVKIMNAPDQPGTDNGKNTRQKGAYLKDAIPTPITPMKSMYEIDPNVRGSISASDNRPVATDLFWLPRWCTGFECDIFVRSAVATVVTITPTFLADRPSQFVVYGYSGHETVPSNASNCYGKIKFMIADSNGGRLTYVSSPPYTGNY